MVLQQSRRVLTVDSGYSGVRNRTWWDVLSLAVLAFAVEETNDRDKVMTSATPFALLTAVVNIFRREVQPQ